jgi:hypothetical protein
MYKYLLPLFIVSRALEAAAQTVVSQETAQAPAVPAPVMEGNTKAYMAIAPGDRAADFLQAFDALRREKTTGKVFFQLSDGTLISNVIDVTAMSHSSLLLFRFNSNQGIRLQVVKIEDIASLGY